MFVIIDGGGLVFDRRSIWQPWFLKWAARGVRYAAQLQRLFLEWSDSMPKRPTITADATGPMVAFKTGDILKRFPVLRSYLTETRYDDSTDRRQPSLLIIRPSGGLWNITLKDPSAAAQLRVAVDDLDKAFPALEALLISSECPWEPDEWQQQRGAKSRKK